jgi:NAD+--asparagine ADP-ribosyltransferase
MHLNLSRDEQSVLRQIAERDGVSVDDAASRLVSSALARRVRKRTGKGPARVYGFKGKSGK